MRRAFRVDSANKSKGDVEREIALHLELRAKEFEAEGMSPEAARAAAREAYGNRLENESEVQKLNDRNFNRRPSR